MLCGIIEIRVAAQSGGDVLRGRRRCVEFHSFRRNHCGLDEIAESANSWINVLRIDDDVLVVEGDITFSLGFIGILALEILYFRIQRYFIYIFRMLPSWEPYHP